MKAHQVRTFAITAMFAGGSAEEEGEVSMALLNRRCRKAVWIQETAGRDAALRRPTWRFGADDNTRTSQRDVPTRSKAIPGSFGRSRQSRRGNPSFSGGHLSSGGWSLRN